MSRKKWRIDTTQGEGLTQKPFEALAGLGNLPEGVEVKRILTDAGFNPVFAGG